MSAGVERTSTCSELVSARVEQMSTWGELVSGNKKSNAWALLFLVREEGLEPSRFSQSSGF